MTVITEIDRMALTSYRFSQNYFADKSDEYFRNIDDEDDFWNFISVKSTQKIASMVEGRYKRLLNCRDIEGPEGDFITPGGHIVEFKFTRLENPRFLQLRPYETDIYWHLLVQRYNDETRIFLLNPEQLRHEIVELGQSAHISNERIGNNQAIEYAITVMHPHDLARWRDNYMMPLHEVSMVFSLRPNEQNREAV